MTKISHILAVVVAVLLWFSALSNFDSTPEWFSNTLESIGLFGWLLTAILFVGYFYVAVIGTQSMMLITGIDESVDILFGGVAFGVLYIILSSSLALTILPEDPGFFRVIFSFLAMAVLFIFMLVGIPLILYLFFFPIGFFVIGVYTIFVPSRTAEIAKKHAGQKRPSDVVELELLQALQSGLHKDKEIQILLYELSPFKRFWYRLKYKIKAKKYREVTALMDAQAESMDGRATLGLSAYELERAKRRHE